MRKSKGQTVDLFYTSKDKTSKKKPKKQKDTNKTNKKKNKKTKTNSQIINLDNEIIIGLTPKVEESKKKKGKNTKKVSVNKATKKPIKKSAKKTKERREPRIKNKTVKSKIVKWGILFILFIAAVILFLLSPVFNIKQIVVINNEKVSSEEVISLSNLNTGINMFKTTNKSIRNSIKSNAYIEDVKIRRSINGTVTLDIKERVPTYMITYANAYVYINNQGYMLEISKKAIKVPKIKGFTTKDEDIKVGNRLNVSDLKRLDSIIKIIEASKNTSLSDMITKVDISNEGMYILSIGSEKKTIRIDEMNNINIKLQMAGEVIRMEKGKKGEIYFQEDGKKAIFKEKV